MLMNKVFNSARKWFNVFFRLFILCSLLMLEAFCCDAMMTHLCSAISSNAAGHCFWFNFLIYYILYYYD